MCAGEKEESIENPLFIGVKIFLRSLQKNVENFGQHTGKPKRLTLNVYLSKVTNLL